MFADQPNSARVSNDVKVQTFRGFKLVFVSFVSCQMGLFHTISSSVSCVVACVYGMIFPSTIRKGAGPPNNPSFLKQFHGRGLVYSSLLISTRVVRQHNIKRKTCREAYNIFQSHVRSTIHRHYLRNGVHYIKAAPRVVPELVSVLVKSVNEVNSIDNTVVRISG